MSNRKTLTLIEQQSLLHGLLDPDGTKKQVARGVRNHTIAALMLYAGLRVGEIVELRWCDLNFDIKGKRTISVDNYWSGQSERRYVPVSFTLYQLLHRYAEYFGIDRKEIDPYFYTFRKGDIRKLTCRQVDRVIRDGSVRILGRPITPMMLRHTFAKILLMTADSFDVARFLGHKHKYSTTSQYHLPTP